MASLFKKVFGGSEKKEEPKPQPQPTMKIDEVKLAQVQNKLNMDIAKLEEEIDQISKVIELKEEEVRQLVAAKKKPQAMTKLQEIKAKRELLEKKEMIKTTLTKTKMQIEMQGANVAIAHTMKEVNTFLKDTEKINEQVVEQIEEFKQYEMESKQQEEYLKQLMQPDLAEKKELESEYAEIERMLQQEEANKFADNLNRLPPTTVPAHAQRAPAAAQKDVFSSAMEDVLKM
eukprot:TRINITY_DN5254_c0_g1_i1.p1 TRINITY_DN5254_c0_g1~~TRINITY_DN5254_c0_g1_i1.p1  ORF type:complete len:231 (-),score=110.62 TRINITY_DN5254_c0_g1_i1:166-858(-)